MLKISLNDGIDDTVPVGQNNQRSQNQENVQSVASGQFINGKFFKSMPFLFVMLELSNNLKPKIWNKCYFMK